MTVLPGDPRTPSQIMGELLTGHPEAASLLAEASHWSALVRISAATARQEHTAARQAQLVERQRQWGVDGVELLDGDEARRRFPWVPDDVLQARFSKGAPLLALKMPLISQPPTNCLTQPLASLGTGISQVKLATNRWRTSLFE